MNKMSAPPIPVLPDLSLLSDRDKIAAIQEYVNSRICFSIALALALITLSVFSLSLPIFVRYLFTPLRFFCILFLI